MNEVEMLKAQLAEAVGALEFIQGALCLTDAPMVKARINQVLARSSPACAPWAFCCSAGDERAAFEGALIKLARENGRTLDHRHFDRSIQTGKYFKAVLESQWVTWQARAALTAPPAATHGEGQV